MVPLQSLINVLPQEDIQPLNLKGVDNASVSEVMVMATPDVKNWLIPGELILTSLFGLSLDQQKRLLTDLNRYQAAGIMIKKNNYLQQISPEIVDYSQQLQLPMLEIQKLTYREILTGFHQLEISSFQFKVQALDTGVANAVKSIIKNTATTAEMELLRAKMKLTVNDRVRLITPVLQPISIREIQALISLASIYLPTLAMGFCDERFYLLVKAGRDFQLFSKNLLVKLANTRFVGSEAVSLNLISTKRKQLINMQKLGVLTTLPQQLTTFESLGVERLFVMLSSQTLGQMLLNPELIQLQRNSPDLFHSLSAYFEADQNITRAAKKLFIHPKSLTYRLKKIEAQLHVDLANAEQVLYLHLCTRFLNLRACGFFVD